MAEPGTPTVAGLSAPVEPRAQTLEAAPTAEQAVHWLVAQLPESNLLNPKLATSLSTVTAVRTQAAKIKADAEAEVAHFMAGRQRRLTAAVRRRQIEATLLTGKDKPGSVAELIRFVIRLLSSEQRLLTELMAISPGVDLFVHHMMDMKHSYGSQPNYDYDTQIDRMRALAHRAQGRLLGFVAFEPFGPNAFTVVCDAINRGFAGVKFYPPSSYKPVDNTAADFKGIIDEDPQVVNERNHELFKYCADNHVPILAHCTPTGMERVDGRTGKYSDPDHWRKVLSHDRYKNLRLCLGHAGGHKGWFDKLPASGLGTSFNNSYACKVVKLCNDFDHVYCDFSHMGAVIDGGQRKVLAQRLARIIKQTPKFAQRMMYGSNFPMLLEREGWADYLPKMTALFDQSAALRPHKSKFFHDNAANYLRLGHFAHERAEDLDETEATGVAIVANGGSLPQVMVGGETLDPLLGASPDRAVDCLILGGGIAGATAARRLRELTNAEGKPHSVLLLEGSGRLGGRMFSLRAPQQFGQPVELGAELIHRPRSGQEPGRFYRIWDEVDRYQLQTAPIDKQNNFAAAIKISSTPGYALYSSCPVILPHV